MEAAFLANDAAKVMELADEMGTNGITPRMTTLGNVWRTQLSEGRPDLVVNYIAKLVTKNGRLREGDAGSVSGSSIVTCMWKLTPVCMTTNCATAQCARPNCSLGSGSRDCLPYAAESGTARGVRSPASQWALPATPSSSRLCAHGLVCCPPAPWLRLTRLTSPPWWTHGCSKTVWTRRSPSSMRAWEARCRYRTLAPAFLTTAGATMWQVLEGSPVVRRQRMRGAHSRVSGSGSNRGGANHLADCGCTPLTAVSSSSLGVVRWTSGVTTCASTASPSAQARSWR